MKYLSFFLFTYLLTALVYAGPNDKWVYAGPTGINFDGIALLLAAGAFAWAYIIYRDFKSGKKPGRK